MGGTWKEKREEATEVEGVGATDQTEAGAGWEEEVALVQSGDLWVFLEGGGVQETRGNLDTRGRVWTGDNRLEGEQCRDGWNPSHTVGECWGQEKEAGRGASHVVGLKQQDLEELEG